MEFEQYEQFAESIGIKKATKLQKIWNKSEQENYQKSCKIFFMNAKKNGFIEQEINRFLCL